PQGDAKQWRYILWDMDAAYGHYTNFTGLPNASATAPPCQVENLPNIGGQGHTLILNKLITENPIARHYYITRYADLLNTVLSCETQNAILDDLTDIMATEMPRQVQRWGGSVTGWENNVQTLRNFINQR
ncbi:CotH kinase family protein, partial [Arthrospira platensis SPKY1]|nr:CotH kinase family protein [Arthrospira platensis SPKY1]